MLVGGNGKDRLDGGDGTDACIGTRKDTYLDCETIDNALTSPGTDGPGQLGTPVPTPVTQPVATGTPGAAPSSAATPSPDPTPTATPEPMSPSAIPTPTPGETPTVP